MQSILIAHSIHIVVLVAVQIILDPFGLQEQRCGEGRIEVLLAGLIDNPFAGQADHLVLSDLQRPPKHRNHKHNNGDVVREYIPPWFQDAVCWLCVHKVPQLSDGNHGLSVEKEFRT